MEESLSLNSMVVCGAPSRQTPRAQMAWEWRVFFRASGVDGASEFAHPGLRLGCKKQRTDVYRPISAEVGLKERGGGGLELKVRSDRDAEGWEKWKKSHVSETDVVAMLAARTHQSPLQGERVTVVKGRVQECVGDSVVEQTELQASVGAGPVQIWRTVAVEGKRSRCAHVVREVLLACKQQATDGQLEMCGYPAFVLLLANEAAAQAEPGAPGSPPCYYDSSVAAPSLPAPALPRSDRTGVPRPSSLV